MKIKFRSHWHMHGHFKATSSNKIAKKMYLDKKEKRVND